MSGMSIEESDNQPVFDLLAEMTAASLERSTLEPQELMMVRIAALVAIDAPPISYLANLSIASELGVTTEQVQGVLTAIAPIVGTPRIVAAGGGILRALGMAIAMAEEDDEAEA